MTTDHKTILENLIEKLIRQRIAWIAIAQREERAMLMASDPHLKDIARARANAVDRCTEDLNFSITRALRALPLEEANAIRQLADERAESRVRARRGERVA